MAGRRVLIAAGASIAVAMVAVTAYLITTRDLWTSLATASERGCAPDAGPPAPEFWEALDRLEALARMPWFRRAASDGREHALMQCRGAVTLVCQKARYDAENRARAAIRTERDLRAQMPGADRDAIWAWADREEDDLDWRAHVGAGALATCRSWAPTREFFERLGAPVSCPACD